MTENNYSAQGASTVAMPPLDILKIQILNKRDAVLREIDNHLLRQMRSGDINCPVYDLRAEVMTFFYMLEASLKRWMSPVDFQKLYYQSKSHKYSDLIACFRNINDLLDEHRITRVDLERSYDSTRVEEENQERGV